MDVSIDEYHDCQFIITYWYSLTIKRAMNYHHKNICSLKSFLSQVSMMVVDNFIASHVDYYDI